MPQRYAEGKYALGECARSGRKMLLKDMVADGQYPNLLVDPAFWEPKHPQEYLPKVEDPIGLYRPSPNRDGGPTPPVLSGEVVFDLDLLSISPTTIGVGLFDFTLTVTGAAFTASSVVRVNGADRATTFISDTQLTAVILEADITATGPLSITVAEGAIETDPQTLTVVADSLFANVQLLVPFEGPDASTTFNDYSAASRTVTRTAGAVTDLDIASPVIGGEATGLFVPTSVLDIADATALNLGSSDFAVECWWRPIAVGGSQMLVAQYNFNSQRGWQMGHDGTNLFFNVWTNGVTFFGGASGAFAAVNGNWYFIQGVRNGNTITIAANGTPIGTLDVTGFTINNSTANVTIGATDNNASPMNGSLEQVRITVGQPRTIAVPTQGFPRG